ncbi:unnamed protein product [Camellia sinensis]
MEGFRTEVNQVMDPNPPAIPPLRKSLTRGVDREAPIKELHNGVLGLTNVLSPKASQIIEDVERETMAEEIPGEDGESVTIIEVQNLTPMASSSKKKKVAGKASGSQRKKYRLL